MPFAQALGGAQRLLRTLIRHGGAEGLELDVVFFEDGPLVGEFERLGAGTSVVALGRFRDVRKGIGAVRALAALTREVRPDVVLSWLPRAHPYLAMAARGTPLAWWQHHNGEGEERLIQAVTRLPAAGVVCTSQAVADIQARVRPRRRLLVCHPGVETPAAPGTEQLAALRAELAIAPGTTVVTLPGRLVAWKGQERFLDALALLRARGCAVTGMLVGGDAGDLQVEHRLRARARELALDCVVTGHVEDPTPYLALSDVVVNASENEPFGMTLPEAMALRVPVLAVASGGPAEIVEPEVSGILVADGRPETLANGLERLVSDAGLRGRLAAAGHERYEAHFRAEAFAARAAQALATVRSG
jgi:glycosyltransferase involved in cell wall biosynthesis